MAPKEKLNLKVKGKTWNLKAKGKNGIEIKQQNQNLYPILPFYPHPYLSQSKQTDFQKDGAKGRADSSAASSTAAEPLLGAICSTKTKLCFPFKPSYGNNSKLVMIDASFIKHT